MYIEGKSGIDSTEQYLKNLHPYMDYKNVQKIAYGIRVRHIKDKAKAMEIKLGG